MKVIKFLFQVILICGFMMIPTFAQPQFMSGQRPWVILTTDDLKNLQQNYPSKASQHVDTFFLTSIGKNVVYLKDGFFRINGKYYHIDENGYIFINSDDENYPANAQGEILTKDRSSVFTGTSKGSSSGGKGSVISFDTSDFDTSIITEVCHGVMNAKFKQTEWSDSPDDAIQVSFQGVGWSVIPCCTGYVKTCLKVLNEKYNYGGPQSLSDRAAEWRTQLRSFGYTKVRGSLAPGDILVGSTTDHVGIVSSGTGTNVEISNMCDSQWSRVYNAQVHFSGDYLTLTPSQGMGSSRYIAWRKP